MLNDTHVGSDTRGPGHQLQKQLHVASSPVRRRRFAPNKITLLMNLRDSGSLKGADYGTLFGLCVRSHPKTFEVDESFIYLAYDLGLDERTIRKSVGTLEKQGLLRRTRKGNRWILHLQYSDIEELMNGASSKPSIAQPTANSSEFEIAEEWELVA